MVCLILFGPTGKHRKHELGFAIGIGTSKTVMAMAKARVTAAQNAEAPTIAQPERKSKDFQMPLE